MIVLSHTAFEGMRDYWTDVPSDPHATAIRRELAELFQSIEKLAVSDRLTPAALGAWANTRVIPRAAAYETLARLKREGDILILLSRRLWNDLLAHGLVDELCLTYFPVVAGGGHPIFTGQHPAAMRLLGQPRRFAGSGDVLLRYAVEMSPQ